MTEAEEALAGVDLTVPNVARIYDYILGGTIHSQADRAVAHRMRVMMPELADAAWANRGFLQRAVRWMAEEAGIRQFIDIGAGLPTQNNTHDAAQAVAPDARVVYVDHDPMVRRQAEHLLAEASGTKVIVGDLRDPGAILGDKELAELIDFAQPVGLVLVAVLHFIGDDLDPWGLVARYVSALAPGSYLALSHVSADRKPTRVVQTIDDLYSRASERPYMRSRAEVERFFNGLELVPPYAGAEPAVTFVGEWGAEDSLAADSDGSRWSYCGVARRPS
jgi:SAM-dependent methyltransferase